MMETTNDVKELIPEFFYMPEFLVNSNGENAVSRSDNVAASYLQHFASQCSIPNTVGFENRDPDCGTSGI